MENKKNVLTYGFIVICVGLSKCLALVREMMLAHFYGTTYAATAFAAASKIPLIFFDITLGTAVASAFIPIFNEYLTKDDSARAFRFASIFITATGLIASGITLLTALVPRVAIKLIAPGFDERTTALASELLRILSPVILLAAVCYCLVGILQSLGEFNRPAIISVVSNLALIAYFLFFNDSFGIVGLSVSLLIGWTLQLLILLPPIFKRGFRHRPVVDFSDIGLKRTAALAVPVLISSWVQPLNTLISTNIASRIDLSSVAVMNYAYQIYFMLSGLFSYGITNLYFPEMSRNFAAGRHEEGRQLLYKLLCTISLVVLPIIAFVASSSTQIVEFVYGAWGGAFTQRDILATSSMLFGYIFGMLGLSWQEILSKYFYSLQDAKTPMKVSMLAIALNIILSIFFSRRIGATGIALASTISITVMAGALFWLCRRNATSKEELNVFSSLKSGALSALFCTLLMVFLNILLPLPQSVIFAIVRLFIIFAIGISSYIGLLLLFKNRLATGLVHIFFKKGGE